MISLHDLQDSGKETFLNHVDLSLSPQAELLKRPQSLFSDIWISGLFIENATEEANDVFLRYYIGAA